MQRALAVIKGVATRSDLHSPMAPFGDAALHEYCASLDATGGGSALPPPAVLRVLASKACRRAVMFGTTLSMERCQAILDGLASCEFPFQCAHGRLTISPALALDALPSDAQLAEHP